MEAERTCKKPAPIRCEYKERRSYAHVVTVHYDNGRTGNLELPRAENERTSENQRAYVRRMVFGQHHMDRKPKEEVEALYEMIEKAIADAERANSGKSQPS